MFIRKQVCFSNALLFMIPHNRPVISDLHPYISDLHPVISDLQPDISVKKRGRLSVKAFMSDQRGLNTVELVVIIAIVIGLALLFRGRITNFVTVLLDGLFSDETAKSLVNGVKVGN